MIYKIEVAESAIKSLKKIRKKDQERIHDLIDSLQHDPRPQGCKKLEGSRNPAYYRVRSGDYRVVYTIQDDILMILVVSIGHRKDIYR